MNTSGSFAHHLNDPHISIATHPPQVPCPPWGKRRILKTTSGQFAYLEYIVYYLSYIILITNSFTGCVPKAQSNRRAAVDWSSSKATASVVYYVRTFRHGSQIRAHPGAAGRSTRATGHRRRSAGPVPSKNSPPYLRAGVKRSRPSHFTTVKYLHRGARFQKRYSG